MIRKSCVFLLILNYHLSLQRLTQPPLLTSNVTSPYNNVQVGNNRDNKTVYNKDEEIIPQIDVKDGPIHVLGSIHNILVNSQPNDWIQTNEPNNQETVDKNKQNNPIETSKEIANDRNLSSGLSSFNNNDETRKFLNLPIIPGKLPKPPKRRDVRNSQQNALPINNANTTHNSAQTKYLLNNTNDLGNKTSIINDEETYTDIAWRSDVFRKKNKNQSKDTASKNSISKNTFKPTSNNLTTNNNDSHDKPENIFMILNSGNIDGLLATSPVTKPINANIVNYDIKTDKNNVSLKPNESEALNKIIDTTINNIATNLLHLNASEFNAKNVFLILNSGNISNLQLKSAFNFQKSKPEADISRKHSFDSAFTEKVERNPLSFSTSSINPLNPILDIKFRRKMDKNQKHSNITKRDKPLPDVNSTQHENPTFRSLSSNVPNSNNNLAPLSLVPNLGFDLNSLNIFNPLDILKRFKRSPEESHHDIKVEDDSQENNLESNTSLKPDPKIDDNSFKLLKKHQGSKEFDDSEESIQYKDTKVNIDEIIDELIESSNEADYLDIIVNLLKSKDLTDFISKTYKDINNVTLTNILDGNIKSDLDNFFAQNHLEPNDVIKTVNEILNNEKTDEKSVVKRLIKREVSDDLTELDTGCTISMFAKLTLNYFLESLTESSDLNKYILSMLNSFLNGNEVLINLGVLELYNERLPLKLKLQLEYENTIDFINILFKSFDEILCKLA